MKNLFIKTLLSVIIVFSLSNCKKDDESSDEKNGTAKVTLIFKINGIGVVDIDTLFLEQETGDEAGKEITGHTDNNGKAVFDNLKPERYDVIAHHTINGIEYSVSSNDPNRKFTLQAGDNKTFEYELVAD